MHRQIAGDASRPTFSFTAISPERQAVGCSHGLSPKGTRWPMPRRNCNPAKQNFWNMKLVPDTKCVGSGRPSPTLIRSADAREALTGDEGTFRIVSGRVSRVSASRGRIYLNFGRNWRQDFTALIPADVMRSWPKPAPDFESLRGKTVRVRGWVRNRNGPLIVIESPSMLDAPDLKPASTTRKPTSSPP